MEGTASKITASKTSSVVYRIIYWLLAPLGLLLCKYILRIKVEGKENLKHIKNKKIILISNHCLYNDPLVILYAIFPRKTFFTMNTRNGNIPILSKFIKTMGGVTLPKNKYPRNITTLFANTHYLHFFPEGNMLHYNQQLQRFYPGAFYIAINNEIPIISITTRVSQRILFGKPSKLLPRKITAIISKEYRPPKKNSSYNKDQLNAWMQQVKQLMQHELN